MFTITRQWISEHAHRRPYGWTAEQLRVVGVQWPLVSGWVDRLVGKVISDDARLQFESFAEKNNPQLQAGDFIKPDFSVIHESNRGRYAAMAMQGMLANPTLRLEGSDGQTEARLAHASMKLADALTKELEK